MASESDTSEQPVLEFKRSNIFDELQQVQQEISPFEEDETALETPPETPTESPVPDIVDQLPSPEKKDVKIVQPRKPIQKLISKPKPVEK